MQRISSIIALAYKELSVDCEFSTLSLRSFTDPDRPRFAYPKLKGRGAEIKDLVVPLLNVFDHYKRPGHRDDRIIMSMLEHQAQLQVILSDNATQAFLSDDDATQVKLKVNAILHDYTLLANAADRRGVHLFSVAPKFHWFWHFGDRARLLNPRKGCTMLDEDVVGVCKIIVESCAHGTDSHNVHSSVVQTYRVGQHFLCTYGDEFTR